MTEEFRSGITTEWYSKHERFRFFVALVIFVRYFPFWPLEVGIDEGLWVTISQKGVLEYFFILLFVLRRYQLMESVGQITYQVSLHVTPTNLDTD